MDNNICKTHFEPALYCEQVEQQKLLYLCKFCVQQRINNQNFDSIQNNEKQQLQQLESKFEQKIKELQYFNLKIEQYSKQIKQQQKNLLKSVEKNLSQIKEKKKIAKKISNGFKSLKQNQIKEQENILDCLLVAQQINNQLQELQTSSKLDQFYQSLAIFSKDENNQVVELVEIIPNKPIDIQFNFYCKNRRKNKMRYVVQQLLTKTPHQ